MIIKVPDWGRYRSREEDQDKDDGDGEDEDDEDESGRMSGSHNGSGGSEHDAHVDSFAAAVDATTHATMQDTSARVVS